ncbi:MAG: TadE/TadG family type IV pilus assembly protein [Anaerolineae bacterium]
MRRNRGQSAVELALVLPLLLLLLLGTVDLGRAFGVWMALSNAAREGARYACQDPYDEDKIAAYVRREVQSEGLAPAVVVVTVDRPSGYGGGNPIVVRVSYSMDLLTVVLFGGQAVMIRA